MNIRENHSFLPIVVKIRFYVPTYKIKHKLKQKPSHRSCDGKAQKGKSKEKAQIQRPTHSYTQESQKRIKLKAIRNTTKTW